MIKAIAFDLDDTLLDTTGILVPKASADAFQILIDNGLNLSMQQCQELRLKMIQTMSHKEVFKLLALQFGTEQTKQALPLAIAAFYEPQLPDTLPLLPGAIENLRHLKQKYKLYIVTAGTESAQREKAKRLGIEPFFENIYVVNSLDKKRKSDAFLDIIQKENIKNDELLCIGNSLSSEIFDAVNMGCVACYFEFGEERSSFPQDPKDKPHFHVRHHGEIVTICKL